jgi:transposase
VRHVQARYFHAGEDTLRDKPRGGRYHSHLTAEQEEQLLAPFLEQAERGEIVIAAPVQQAYENQLGYPVHHSVVYRALHRHGWRKVQPRPRHLKADAAAQEEFKKTFRRWSKKKRSIRQARAARSG